VITGENTHRGVFTLCARDAATPQNRQLLLFGMAQYVVFLRCSIADNYRKIAKSLKTKGFGVALI